MNEKALELRMTFYETFETLSGEKVERIKSSFFYLMGFGSFFLGLYLLLEGVRFGVFLFLFLAPVLILYPAIRFLLGGKGGLLPAFVTVIVEEYLKIKIKENHKEKKKKNC